MYLSSNGTPALHINRKLLKLLFVTLLLIFTGCSGSTSSDPEQEESEEVTVTEKEAVDALGNPGLRFNVSFAG